MSRVIFLDIDGVMIPATQVLVNPRSTLDRVFPATTIAAINELCRRTGAKIVFNTTHNGKHDGVADIDEAMIIQGCRPEYLHADCNTRYPVLSRPEAVRRWLDEHPEVNDDDWVAIDDAMFLEDDPHMILVDPDAGLHTGHVNAVLDQWGCTPLIICM